jgi:ElaB/YqjD/DUF883 family membrane-anchored ribosome-binding protein
MHRAKSEENHGIAHMTTRSKTAAEEEIVAIRELVSDLETRMKRLGGAGKREFSGASDDIHEYVNETLARIVKSARDGADSLTDSLADSASRMGSDAVARLGKEVEERPLVMLAVAAGIGFLFGLARR